MTVLSKAYLALVGLMYIGLAAWCSFDPATTSKKVGFQLLGDSGQSEFLTVYGGLEFGLGLMFLMPLFRPDSLRPVLSGCVLIHGSLVLFRTIGFLLYPKAEAMTVQLAIGEWVLLIAGLLLMKLLRSPQPEKTTS